MSGETNKQIQCQTEIDASKYDAATDRQSTSSAVSGLFGTAAGVSLSNFDGTPVEKWKLESTARGSECESVDDWVGKTINLKYFYVHKIELADMKGGEFSDCIRCVLFDISGKAVSCVSKGISDDLAHVINTFGLKPYDPPIQLKIVKIKTRQGFTTYTLQPA